MKYIQITLYIVFFGFTGYVYSNPGAKRTTVKPKQPLSSSSKPVITPRYTQLSQDSLSTEVSRPSSPVVGSGVQVDLKSVNPIGNRKSLSFDTSQANPVQKKSLAGRYVKDGNDYFVVYDDGISKSLTKQEFDKRQHNKRINAYTGVLGGRVGGLAFDISTAVKNFFTISPEFKAATSQAFSNLGNKVTSLFLPKSTTGVNSASGTSTSVTSGPTASRQAENAFLKQFKVGEDGKRGTPSSAENSQYFSNLPSVDKQAAKAFGTSTTVAQQEGYNPVVKLSSSKRSVGATKTEDFAWDIGLTAADTSGKVSRNSQDFSGLYV